MSGISLQQSANSVLVDSPTKKIKYPVSDSFLKTQESVKSKDSESVSIFPELGENNTALEIGAAILGTTALVLGARKCGVAKSLLSKLKINPFP